MSPAPAPVPSGATAPVGGVGSERCGWPLPPYSAPTPPDGAAPPPTPPWPPAPPALPPKLLLLDGDVLPAIGAEPLPLPLPGAEPEPTPCAAATVIKPMTATPPTMVTVRGEAFKWRSLTIARRDEVPAWSISSLQHRSHFYDGRSRIPCGEPPGNLKLSRRAQALPPRRYDISPPVQGLTDRAPTSEARFVASHAVIEHPATHNSLSADIFAATGLSCRASDLQEGSPHRHDDAVEIPYPTRAPS